MLKYQPLTVPYQPVPAPRYSPPEQYESGSDSDDHHKHEDACFFNLSSHQDEFLTLYLHRLKFHLKNDMLHINPQEETLDFQIRQYISKAVGISDPDADELLMFTTEEVKSRASLQLHSTKQRHKQLRDDLFLNFNSKELFIEVPKKYADCMNHFLETIEENKHESPETILKKLGYETIVDADNSQEVTVEKICEKVPPVQRKSNHEPESERRFVESYEVDLVIYQCDFCKRNGDPYEGHWEVECVRYKEHQEMMTRKQQFRAYQAPPAHFSSPATATHYFATPAIYPYTYTTTSYPMPPPAKTRVPQHYPAQGRYGATNRGYGERGRQNYNRRQQGGRSRMEGQRSGGDQWSSNLSYSNKQKCDECGLILPRHELRCSNRVVKRRY